MNNTERQRIIMIKYALKLINMAIKNNYVLYYRTLECRNIVWDCQSELMEWSTAKISKEDKEEFYQVDELAYGYAKQLLLIANSAVQLKEPGFENITLSDLKRIILI